MQTSIDDEEERKAGCCRGREMDRGFIRSDDVYVMCPRLVALLVHSGRAQQRREGRHDAMMMSFGHELLLRGRSK